MSGNQWERDRQDRRHFFFTRAAIALLVIGTVFGSEMGLVWKCLSTARLWLALFVILLMVGEACVVLRIALPLVEETLPSSPHQFEMV